MSVMPHRRFIDYVLGRHYCPACGRNAGFDTDYSGGGQTKRFRLAPVKTSCRACGAQVRGYMRPGFILAMLLWASFAGAAVIGVEAMVRTGTIPSSAVTLAKGLVLVAMWISGLLVIQYYMDYRVKEGSVP